MTSLIEITNRLTRLSCASICGKNVEKLENETTCEGEFQFCKLKEPEGKEGKLFPCPVGKKCEDLVGINRLAMGEKAFP